MPGHYSERKFEFAPEEDLIKLQGPSSPPTVMFLRDKYKLFCSGSEIQHPYGQTKILDVVLVLDLRSVSQEEC